MTRPGMELTCEQLVEIITEYLDGAMPADDRLRFEDHLEICKGCQNYLEQMRRTIRAVGYLTEEDIPAEARASLLDAFRSWKSSR